MSDIEDRLPALIVLNGASSAGKTTLARHLQARWPRPLLLLSLDKTLAQLPFSYVGDGADADAGHAVRRGPDGAIEIVVGPLGREADRVCGATIRHWLKAGHDVVVDYVFVDAEMVQAVLGPAEELGVRPARIAVRCDVAVLEAREMVRGNRLPGLAAHVASFVHDSMDADFEVDTSATPSPKLAELICARLAPPR